MSETRSVMAFLCIPLLLEPTKAGLHPPQIMPSSDLFSFIFSLVATLLHSCRTGLSILFCWMFVPLYVKKGKKKKKEKKKSKIVDEKVLELFMSMFCLGGRGDEKLMVMKYFT